jgi:hypothetical protein
VRLHTFLCDAILPPPPADGLGGAACWHERFGACYRVGGSNHPALAKHRRLAWYGILGWHNALGIPALGSDA